MGLLSGNSCNIITLLPLGLDCDSINASTPEATNGFIALYITGGDEDLSYDIDICSPLFVALHELSLYLNLYEHFKLQWFVIFDILISIGAVAFGQLIYIILLKKSIIKYI